LSSFFAETIPLERKKNLARGQSVSSKMKYENSCIPRKSVDKQEDWNTFSKSTQIKDLLVVGQQGKRKIRGQEQK
jgi:hypothetical protein